VACGTIRRVIALPPAPPDDDDLLVEVLLALVDLAEMLDRLGELVDRLGVGGVVEMLPPERSARVRSPSRERDRRLAAVDSGRDVGKSKPLTWAAAQQAFALVQQRPPQGVLPEGRRGVPRSVVWKSERPEGASGRRQELLNSC
jgi:hypothetical protein